MGLEAKLSIPARPMSASVYWGRVAADLMVSRSAPSWRRYSDQANRALLESWLPGDLGCCLKTDLFDEAWTGGFLEGAGGDASKLTLAIGVDVSPTLASFARARRPDIVGLAADVRELPFEEGSFDTVVSTSTLDHFDDVGEIRRALQELRRVLAPGGRLLITLDNPHHPIVALRRRGMRLWRRLGFVPYHVGMSLDADRLREALEVTGFSVLREGATQHFPRLLLVALGGWARPRVIDAAVAFERMARLRTRYRTGQFVCVLACRAT